MQKRLPSVSARTTKSASSGFRSQSTRPSASPPARCGCSGPSCPAAGSPSTPRTHQGYQPAAARVTGENSTDRIPEQVLSPLLIWALRWVEDFADDIIRAQQEWNDLKNLPVFGRQLPPPPGTPPAYERLDAVLDRYRAAGRKLPLGWKTNGPYNDRSPVNHAHLARQAQCYRGTPAKAPCAALVDQAVGNSA